jgi:anaerobic selenocysteine-containing dehydrogenase
LDNLLDLLRKFDGPATSNLKQEKPLPGLGMVPERISPDGLLRTVCGYCSTGCGLLVHLKDGQATNLSPDPDYPVNLGMACPKGWEALAPVLATDRGRTPLLRNRSNGKLEPVSWETAIGIFVEKLRDTLATHGPDGAAFLSTGQIPTEEMLFLGALWKIEIGARAADSNTRQCMATAHAAYKESFGFDAPPFTYADFEESDHLVFIGANPAIAHPILWERVVRNRRNPVIAVVDPRFTETAAASHRHVAISNKSDLTLLYAMAGEVVRRGWVDAEFVSAHTSGFDDFCQFIGEYPVERALAECSIPREDFEFLVDLLAPGKRTSIWWTMGVNQSHQATRTAQAIIDLCLMTGNIGKPGTGPNSITGQMNAMGSRLFSCTSSLPGGRDWKEPAHRQEIASYFGIEEGALPTGPGLAYDQILDHAAAGNMGFLWVVATNPAHSWIGQTDFVKAAQGTFLVVQDAFPDTETALLADLYLPSGPWGEKDGSIINSERRLGRIRRCHTPPGEALSDFDIFRLVAMAWGVRGRIAAWQSAEDVFQSMRELSRQRPCDFSGILSLTALETQGGVQWPCPQGAYPPVKERRLFEDGRFFTPDARARFVYSHSSPAPELPDAAYPLRLMTGRGTSSQWHTLTRTNRSPLLKSVAPKDSIVEMHPADAKDRGLAHGDWVRIASRRGEARARVVVAATVREGNVFLPMHAPDVNRLTNPVFDPHSREPSYKDGAVQVFKT